MSSDAAMSIVPLSETAPTAPPPVITATDAAQLDRALVRGIAWTGAVKWGSQLLAWLATLAVARILTPQDYGLVAMGALYLGLTALLSEFGVGAAVVMLPDLGKEQIAQINTLAVLFGVCAFALSCLLAIPLGHFFNAPDLPPVVAALSLAFVLTGIRTVPYSLMQKELRFKRLAFIDGVQTVLASGSMVVFALLGLRYWTLVLGGLLGTGSATALVLASSRARFARPHFASLKRAIMFSWHIVVARLSFYVYSSADLFVAGKMLGSAALGAYSFAATLATLLPEKIVSLLASVTPSVFARSERSDLRRYVLSITEGLALITFPATLGLAAVAEDFVLVVLGERWRPMITPLRILAGYAGFRSIAPLPAQVLNVIHETRFAMWVQLVAAVLFPLAFYLASRWGAAGIAAAWVIVHPMLNLPLYWRAFTKIELSVRQYLLAIAPALVGSAIMLVAIWGASVALPPVWPRSARLLLQVLAGVVTYVAALLVLRPERARHVYRTLKLMRG
jgi:O-antigen/teichoic acid export membrane protein